jgi:hypothetical protein|tara:strand:- start:512 stop:745 length:234 start_codon:yes stop_codon:yes gene_type:complete
MLNKNFNKKEKAMSKEATVKKTIKFAQNKFNLEIYLGLEKNKISWEIFPHDYNAALYAFSNKDRITKLIEDKYILEK